MKPLISVLVPSYNYERYVAKAIDSALGGSYPNVEVVVTDDRSTDGAAELIAQRYAGEPRVRFTTNERNLGVVGNFNRGLSLARGAFVHWLGTDDWFLPDHLERLQALFEREPQLDVVYTRPYFVDELGRISGVKVQENMLASDYVAVRDEFPEMLVGMTPVAIPATMFRRELFDELGALDTEIPILFDWELFVRLAAAGKRFGFLNDPSVCVRLHAASASGEAFNERGGIGAEGLQIVEKYLAHPAMERLRGRGGRIVEQLDHLGQIARNRIAASGLAGFEARFEVVRDALVRAEAAYVPAAVRDRQISVILPALGPYHATVRAVDSVARQTYDRWQIVLLDQTSFPLRAALREHPAWERIAYLRLEAPQPPGAVRNLGVRIARGEYITFLDDDNTVAPNHLESLVATLERSGADVAVCATRLIVERLDPHGVAREPERSVDGLFRTADDPPAVMAVANSLPLNAILHHRRFFEAAGRFNERALLLEDFDYLSRLLNLTSVAFSGVTTLEVRARVDLAFQALGRYGPGHYLPILDALYAARPVDAALEPARAAHRRRAAEVLERLPVLAATAAGVVELTAALTGRSAFSGAGTG